MSIAWAAAAQAAIEIGKTAYNNYSNRKAAKKGYDYELALMQYQNEYNKPINQMKRYEEAGLNPNLIYGQSNLSASGSAPSVQPSRYEGNGLMDYYNLKNMSAQLDNVKANTKNTESRTLNELVLTNQQANKLALENEAMRQNIKFAQYYDLPVGVTNTYTTFDSAGRHKGAQAYSAGQSLYDYFVR